MLPTVCLYLVVCTECFQGLSGLVKAGRTSICSMSSKITCLVAGTFCTILGQDSIYNMKSFRVLISGIFAPVNAYFTISCHVTMCASVLMIVALSHERYFAICSPHAYRIHLRSVQRWKHLAKYIVPVLILSVFFNVPIFINLKKEMLKNSLYVKVNLYLRGLHPLSTTGLLPILYLIFANIKISKGIQKLRQPRKLAVKSEITKHTSDTGELTCNVIRINSKYSLVQRFVYTFDAV